MQLALIFVFHFNKQNKKLSLIEGIIKELSHQVWFYLDYTADPQLRQYIQPFVSSLKNVNSLIELNQSLENIGYFCAVLSLLKERNLLPINHRQREELLSSLRNNINSMEGIHITLNYILGLNITDKRKGQEYVNQTIQYAGILSNRDMINLIVNIPDHWRFRNPRIVDEIFARCQNAEGNNGVFAAISTYMEQHMALVETHLRATGMFRDTVPEMAAENFANNMVPN